MAVRSARPASRVPLSTSRAAGRTVDLIVYAPQHTFAGPRPGGTGATTVSPFPLDESARYFQVSMALRYDLVREEHLALLPRPR